MASGDTHIFQMIGMMPYFAYEFEKSEEKKIKKRGIRLSSLSRFAQNGDVTKARMLISYLAESMFCEF